MPRLVIIAGLLSTVLLSTTVPALARADVADLAVSTGADVLSANEGQPVTLLIRVANLGPDEDTGVSAKDELPPGLRYVSHLATSGTYDDVTGDWTIGYLANGDTDSLFIYTTVDTGSAGKAIVNTATVAGASADPLPANNLDSVSVDVDTATALHVETGRYTGDGAGSKPIDIGFAPDAVLIKGNAPTPTVMRTSSMAGDASKELPLGNALVANRIVSLDANGFTVGSDTSVNNNGVEYYWAAFQSAPGQLVAGSYAGDAQIDRIIPVGFRPTYVMVIPEGTIPSNHRVAQLAPNKSFLLSAASANSNRIKDFDPTGFVVGSNVHVNGAGQKYHYLAWAEIPGYSTSGIFTGDGTGQRHISSPGFEPDVVIVQHTAAGFPSVLASTASMPDGTLPNDPSSGIFSNGVKAFLPDGFRVGSHVGVNDAGQEFLYVAFGDGTPAANADVALAMGIDDANPDQGQTVTYTLTFVNNGPDTATSVVVTDLLPGGTTYVSDIPTLGSYDNITGAWTVGTVPSGGGETLSVTATVDSGTAGAVITNVARITGMNEIDPDTANNGAVAIASVNPETFAVMTGTYTGTGVGPRVITGLGVQPSVVFVRSADASPTIVRTATMPGGLSKQLGQNNALVANRILSLDIDGFTVGDAPGVNTFGVEYYWTAFCAGDSVMALGSYIGNDVDNRDYVAVGFQPDYLIVVAETNEHAMQRFATEPFDESLPFHNDGKHSDRIQDFIPLGFQVGKDNTVNQSGTRYHFLAWREAPGSVEQKAYTGNGTPGWITTAFLPEFVALKNDGGQEGVHRNGDSGVYTMPFQGSAPFTGGITSLLPNRFDVGADDRVNKSGDLHHWVAFHGSPHADLDVAIAVDDAFPSEGDTIRFDITLANLGPSNATGVQAEDVLPAGLVYTSDSPSQGTYLNGSGLWAVGVIAAGDTVRLAIDALVDGGTGGSTIDNVASIIAVNEPDTVGVNDTDTASITVQTTPIVLNDEPGSLYPAGTFAGQPDLKIRIGVNNVAVIGVLLDTSTRVTFTDGANTYSATLANPTYVPAGASDFTISFVSAAVPGGMTTGVSLPLTLYLSGTTDQSVVFADTLVTAGSNEISIEQRRVGIEALVLGDVNAPPGLRNETLLAIKLSNGYASPRTLDTLVVSNVSSGPGSQAQLDAELETLYLYADEDSSGDYSTGDALLATESFAAGRAAFVVGGAWTLPAGAVERLIVAGDIDSSSTDADRLDVALQWSSDIVFAEPTLTDDITPLWPANSFGAITVDGMAAHQLSVIASADTVYSGEVDRLIATVVVPQNGYQSDVLNGFDIADGSGNFSAADFSAMRAFIDDGDGIFDPGIDTAAGPMVFSGDRYSITGLGVPIAGTLRLFVAADVAPAPVTGHTFRARIPVAGITVNSGNDGPVDAAVASANDIVIINVEQIDVTSLPLVAAALNPGDGEVAMLRLRLVNSTLAPVTLESLDLGNNTRGAGSASELDAAFESVDVYADDGNGIVDPWDTLLSGGLQFSAGALTTGALGVTLPVGAPYHLLVVCAVDSFCAADLDTLSVEMAGAESLQFGAPQLVAGDFPMATSADRVIDGMMNLQIPVYASADSAVVTTPTDNVVFEFELAGNGYRADTLRTLRLTNQGTATPAHLSRLALYADGGDGAFDAGVDDDVYLGDFTVIGLSAYTLTGLDVPLGSCAAYTRFFAAADLTADPPSGASIQFMIPLLGIQVASGNDGPIDAPVIDPSVQFVPKPDELTAFPYSVGNSRVHPGSESVLNFGVGFYNGFANTVTLQDIDLFQQGTAISSEIDIVRAYADVDSNGLFDPGVDLLLSSTTSTNPYYSLDGLALALAPKKITYLFVSYDVGLGVRDSVSVDLQLNSPSDLNFQGGNVDVAGEFPLNSPGRHFTDGMIAAQISTTPAPEYRASPGEDNVLGLQFTIPRNGILQDVLRFVSIRNTGNALAGQDITTLNLWVEDNGDGSFDPLHDRLVSTLTWAGSGWRNPFAISELIGAGGLACYVTADITLTAADNRTLQLLLPVGGIQVTSGNDGPIDTALMNPVPQVISTDPLLTSITFDRATYSEGQTVTVTMQARNAGLIPITGVHPSVTSASGPGVLIPDTGPAPASADLAPGADTTFAWTFVAAAAGRFDVCAGAFDADSTEASEPTCAGGSIIQKKPFEIAVSLDDIAPTGVNRGQRTVPLSTLTFSYSGYDSLSAPVSLHRFAFGLVDQGGAPVAPNSRLERVTITASTGNSFNFSTVDSTVSPMRFLFDPPINVVPGSIVTLNLSADIAAAATLAPFGLVVDAIGNIDLRDANDGIAVAPTSGNTFPWLTNTISVTVPAETLYVTTDDTSSVTINVGQAGILVLDGTLVNDSPAQSADVRISRVAVDFYDLGGQPIDAGDVIRQLSIHADGTQQFFTEVFPVGNNRVICDLTNTLQLSANVPERLELRAEARSFPARSGFHVTVAAAASVVARDVNSGAAVPVMTQWPAGFPLPSRSLRFQLPATRLQVSGHTDNPETILPSASGVRLLTVSLSHADTVDASAIVIDKLDLEFIDPLGTPLHPGDWLSALRLVSGADTVAAVTTLSITESVVQCNLTPPLVLAPGDSDSIAVYIDAKNLVAPTRFYVRVERDQVFARDANNGQRILGIEGAFPLVHGPFWLRVPGANIFLELTSRTPANVTETEQGLAAFDLTVENRNAPGYTGATLSAMTIGIVGSKTGDIPATDILSGAYLSLGDTATVMTSSLGSDVTFAFVPPLDIDAGEAIAMTLKVDLDSRATNCAIQFVIRDAASLAMYDAGNDEILAPQSTNGYPLKTAPTHVLGADATVGFTNYPNPFGAGRELTHVTFFLEEPSRVTLKLYTLWGKPVKTLLSGSRRDAGLHQDVTWDGRTGEGDTVNNGVYYLVLETVGDSGKNLSLKRKVAVAR